MDEVPHDRGFPFCTGNGIYVGMTDVSLSDFGNKLKKVEVDSIKYHFLRNDFQNWVKDVLSDEELSEKISTIRRNRLEMK
jgi:hypothetical protein